MPAGSWLEVPWAKHVWKVTSVPHVSYCNNMFGKNKEKKEIEWHVLEFFCTVLLLEGIFNWINNCPIPISQLDLTAQMEDCVLWEREKKSRRERNIERHEKTQEEKPSTRDSMLEIDKRKTQVAMIGKTYRWTGQMRRDLTKTTAVQHILYYAIFRVRRTSSEWPPTRKTSGSFPTGRALTDPSR